LIEVTVTVYVVFLPPATVRLDGETDTLKFVTARVAVVPCVTPLLVPEMFSVKLPAADAGGVTDNTLDPVPVTVAGEKLTLEPEGAPVRPRVIRPAKPFKAVRLTLYCAVKPPSTDREDGVAAIVKSGAVTVRPTLVECFSDPLLPPMEML
jgi:hypothetical protein